MTLDEIEDLDIRDPGNAHELWLSHKRLRAALESIASMKYPLCGNHFIRVAAAALRNADSGDREPEAQ